MVAPARLKAANEVDVTTLSLPENDLAVVTEVLGTTVVKLDELARLTRDPRYVDQLVNDPKLASEARKIFFAIHRSVLGQHVGNGNAPQNKDGAAGPDVVNIFARRYAEVPKGETAPQKQLREDLPLALIGQENKLDRFVDLLKDYESGARLTPPLMALTGDPAHGKDQAIKGFAQSVLGPDAEVIAINCADLDVTKGHFDKDSILGPERLKKIADGKPAAVIRLQNPEVLAQKPREAAALAELLSAEKETPKYARVIYFLDFETLKGDDVSQRMVCALGATKNELLSCSAEFQHLDGPAMAKYARLLEKKILRQAGLDGIVVDYDPRALEFLGEMLATPHRPLDVLSQRLLRFVFDQFDTQTSVRRKGAKLNVTLAPPYDEELAIERTETLKAVRAEKVDLRKHDDVFFAQEVGIVGVEAPDVTAARAFADQLVPALEAQAMRLATLVPARAAGIDASVGALGQRVLDFANDLATVLARAEHSVRIALADIADSGTVERLVLAIEDAMSDSQALRAALDKQGKPLQAALTRLEAHLTQARTLVDGLAAEHARVNPAE